jgi:hypothetical protein
MQRKINTYVIAPLVLLLLAVIICFKSPAAADLVNTKWKGVLNAPGPEDGMLEFKKDSVLAYIGGQIIETSHYSLKGDTLMFQKLSGGSPCTPTQVGKYLYAIKSDVLTIKMISEDCDARIGVFSDAGYKRQK